MCEMFLTTTNTRYRSGIAIVDVENRAVTDIAAIDIHKSA
jgi:hypothetical protein